MQKSHGVVDAGLQLNQLNEISEFHGSSMKVRTFAQ